MIHGRDVILVSSVEWDFLWQHAQEIAQRLADAGNRVLFIENTGVRTPGFKDLRRVASRFEHWTKSLASRGVRQVRPNLFVCSPLVVPPFGPIWRRQINKRLLLPLVRRAARNLGMRDPIIWTHLPTNTAAELIRLLRTPRSIVIYYCIADFSKLTPHGGQLKRSEAEIVRTSNLVFANSAQLADHCRQWRDDVHVYSPGVNMSAFATSNGETQTGPAQQLRNLKRDSSDPIVGYVGGLHRYVDFELLSEMARSRPNWLWAMVGPAQTPLGDLANLRNVMFFGQRPHAELIDYIRSFDVCIVPYLNNEQTATVVPIKINEYLAAGKPVVAADLPAIRVFNETHDGVLRIAARDEFLKEIETALLAPNGDSVTKRRQAVAAQANWEQRLEAMSQFIEHCAEQY